MASFEGFSAMISLVDKRIDPARYGGTTDISSDEKAINDEIKAEEKINILATELGGFIKTHEAGSVYFVKIKENQKVAGVEFVKVKRGRPRKKQ